MSTCYYCKKKVNNWENYCSSDCMIAKAKKEGKKEFLPNNLPIRCIKHSGLYEHEHGDHPDYKFPVEVMYTKSIPNDLPPSDCSFKNQHHAFIYTDGNIVLTMYECTYNQFYLSPSKRDEWVLTESSINKIINYIAKKKQNV